jgi:hypothetical protein
MLPGTVSAKETWIVFYHSFTNWHGGSMKDSMQQSASSIDHKENKEGLQQSYGETCHQ